MPTPYAGNTVYIASIDIPIDSDPPDASSLAVPLQQLADRTAYLQDVVTGGAGATFNDVTLTGTTTISGTLQNGTLNTVSLIVTGVIGASAQAIALTATTTSLGLAAATDITLAASDDITLTATDDVTVTCADLTILTSGATTVNALVVQGALTANDPAIFADAVTINDLLTVEDINCTGGLEVAGAFFADVNLIETASGKEARFGGKVMLQGVGHWVERPLDVANADTTYSVNDASIFFIPSGHSAHTYTLADTAAVAGSWMRWYCEQGSAFTLKQSDGTTTIAVLNATPGSGEYYWIDLMNKGSGSNRWRIAGGQKEP